MQINKLSQSNRTNSLNFGKLYNGYCISENILKTNNKALKKELNSISRLIRKEELHKAENVDIILQYTLYMLQLEHISKGEEKLWQMKTLVKRYPST